MAPPYMIKNNQIITKSKTDGDSKARAAGRTDMNRFRDSIQLL